MRLIKLVIRGFFELQVIFLVGIALLFAVFIDWVIRD